MVLNKRINNKSSETDLVLLCFFCAAYWVFGERETYLIRSGWVLMNITRFYWILLGFTEFYWVLLGFTEF